MDFNFEYQQFWKQIYITFFFPSVFLTVSFSPLCLFLLFGVFENY